MLEPHQGFHAIFLGEAGNSALLVLRDAAAEIVGNSDVESSVPAAGENIDSWLYFIAPCRTL